MVIYLSLSRLQFYLSKFNVDNNYVLLCKLWLPTNQWVYLPITDSSEQNHIMYNICNNLYNLEFYKKIN